MACARNVDKQLKGWDMVLQIALSKTSARRERQGEEPHLWVRCGGCCAQTSSRWPLAHRLHRHSSHQRLHGERLARDARDEESLLQVLVSPTCEGAMFVFGELRSVPATAGDEQLLKGDSRH